MAKEIERRFLLRSANLKALWSERKASIRQGYFEVPDPKDSYRVRIIDNTDASHAVKVGQGISRDEEEDGTSLAMGNSMMNICHHRIVKTRHYVERAVNRLWEIDVFEGVLDGIVLAECELDSENEPVSFPSWFGPIVEVTDSLTNLHLARLATDLTSTEKLAIPAVRAHLASKIKRIVIAGGPGSGKSTFILDLSGEYPDVQFCPEVASIVIGQVGIDPPSTPLEENRFQQAVYRTQKIFERTSIEYAASLKKRAVVFDRGTVDAPVYLTGGVSQFEGLFRTSMKAELASYDAVIFLDIPPEDVYERICANNPSRSENYEDAVKRNEGVRKLWSEHPNCYIVPEHDSWEDKRDFARRIFDLLLRY